MEWINRVHEFCIIWMTAVIWCVQLIIYPSFRKIDSLKFKAFHELHTRNITFIVTPAMLLEMGTAHLIFWKNPFNQINLQLLISIHLVFLSTFFFSVPFHHRLNKSFSEEAATKLERLNWIRTLIWTYEFILVLNV